MANEDFQNGFIVGLSSRGNPISENGTTEIIEQVQTDWEQNDSEAVDYIKNRPFYREGNAPFVIESDTYCNREEAFGFVEGEQYKVEYLFDDNTTLVRYAPAIPLEDLWGFKGPGVYDLYYYEGNSSFDDHNYIYFFLIDNAYVNDDGYPVPEEGKAAILVNNRINNHSRPYKNLVSATIYVPKIKKIDVDFLPNVVNDATKDYVAEEGELILASAKDYNETFVVNKIGEHNTSTTAHTDIREELGQLKDKINNFLNMGTDFDEISEILNFITSGSREIATLLAGKVNYSDIVNSLESDATDKPLSAAQGKYLKELVDAIDEEIKRIDKKEINYKDIKDTPKIPVNLSDLVNDINILTTSNVSVSAGAHINEVGTPTVTKTVNENNIDFSFDYLKGEKGEKGDPGDPGLPGLDGEKGDDGISVTHEWKGTTLYVTSASGTSSADLKGESGEIANEATQTEKGLMSAADKTKLDEIPNIYETLVGAQTKANKALEDANKHTDDEIDKVEGALETLKGAVYTKTEVDGKTSAMETSIQENTDALNSLEENTYSKEEVDTKVTLFHATLDPITTQYIKDSGDFTYADVLATENCKIEASFGNVTIILNKEIIRNIEPDPVTGRYVEFSALLRNGPTTVKVFFFVYDPENLPTDPESVAALENWGDSQYCGIVVQHIVIGDFLDGDIAANRYSTLNAPSTKAAGDYTDSKCNVVLEYMQTTFVENMLALGDMRYPAAPTILYYNANGFEATNSNVGDDWNLEGMDFTPYKRLKFYVRSAGSSNDNFTPSHIVEMDLDPNAKSYKDCYVAGHTAQNPNNANRLHNVTFAVSADKTKVQFARATSLYGTASTSSSGGRICYKIEGYIY